MQKNTWQPAIGRRYLSETTNDLHPELRRTLLWCISKHKPLIQTAFEPVFIILTKGFNCVNVHVCCRMCAFDTAGICFRARVHVYPPLKVVCVCLFPPIRWRSVLSWSSRFPTARTRSWLPVCRASRAWTWTRSPSGHPRWDTAHRHLIITVFQC